MKRFILLLAVIVLLLPAIPCAAAEDLYCTYTPKSENSSLFFIDIYSSRKVAGAVMELSFDDSFVSYRSAAADSTAAAVRDRADSGKVRIAFADSSAVSGKLCRLSFKALQAGEVSFTLHMEQAADGEKRLLTGWNDYTMKVTFSEDDVADGSSSRSGRVSSRSSGSSSRGGGKSTISADDADNGVGDDDMAGDRSGGFFDLRGDHSLKWMLIGAGVPVLIGMLLWTGFVYGKKYQASKEETKKPGDDEPGQTEDQKEEQEIDP